MHVIQFEYYFIMTLFYLLRTPFVLYSLTHSIAVRLLTEL